MRYEARIETLFGYSVVIWDNKLNKEYRNGHYTEFFWTRQYADFVKELNKKEEKKQFKKQFLKALND